MRVRRSFGPDPHRGSISMRRTTSSSLALREVTGENEDLGVPIVGGTLEQYEPYVLDAG
ncbi:hypothetical protein [Arthrobacter sp. CAN_A2]|uniref:hypothetical protein n=1 Tax=Arthrobacter sp. CAN_A2 TaxID=2787718 RepID=UPI0018EF5AF3